MRRLLRWAFGFVTAMLAVLCVAMVVLWVRSYQVRERLDWVHHPHADRIEIAVGKISIMTVMFPEEVELTEPPGLHHEMLPDLTPTTAAWVEQDHAWNLLGLVFQGPNPVVAGFVFRFRLAIIPCWMVIVLTSLPSLASVRWWTKRWFVRRRIPSGHCPTCGYDLRATPERCPECGAVPNQIRKWIA
jgi:hypothetical protein